MSRYYTTVTEKFPGDLGHSFGIYFFPDTTNPPLDRVDVAYALIDKSTINEKNEIPDMDRISEQVHLFAPRSKENKIIVNAEQVEIFIPKNGLPVEYFGKKYRKSLESILN